LPVYFACICGTGLLIGIAASMPGSEAVGGEFLPKDSIFLVRFCTNFFQVVLKFIP